MCVCASASVRRRGYLFSTTGRPSVEYTNKHQHISIRVVSSASQGRQAQSQGLPRSVCEPRRNQGACRSASHTLTHAHAHTHTHTHTRMVRRSLARLCHTDTDRSCRTASTHMHTFPLTLPHTPLFQTHTHTVQENPAQCKSYVKRVYMCV